MDNELFEIRLEAFEGPLDLLLHLVDKNKVDIYDIPIVTITDQYIAYVDRMENRDMDVMSEFLLMAATLLAIKSKMLLPVIRGKEEEYEDPRMELIERLVEYKAYKEMARELRDMQVDAAQNVYRAKSLPEEVLSYEEPVEIEKLIGDLTLGRLNAVFKEVLKRQSLRRDPVRSAFGEIKKEELTVEERVEEILRFAESHKRFTFISLFEDVRTRMMVIVTFLALLELMKDGRLYIVQENIYDDIIIERRAA